MLTGAGCPAATPGTGTGRVTGGGWIPTAPIMWGVWTVAVPVLSADTAWPTARTVSRPAAAQAEPDRIKRFVKLEVSVGGDLSHRETDPGPLFLLCGGPLRSPPGPPGGPAAVLAG